MQQHCLINNISVPKKVINLTKLIKLTKNYHLDKYKYNGYGKGFGSCSEFLLSDDSLGKIVIIFGADMSSSVHIESKGKGILFLGKGS